MTKQDYAFPVQVTHSTTPRYRVGEWAVVKPHRQPQAGDDVLVTVGQHQFIMSMEEAPEGAPMLVIAARLSSSEVAA